MHTVSDPEGFAALTARYLDYLSVQQFSPATLVTRTASLGYFIAWCNDRSLTRPDQIDTPMAERYQRHLHHHRKADGRPLAIGTQRGQMTAVRMFFRWLVKAGWLRFSPLEAIELPPLPQRLPRSVLSHAEIERVLAQIDTTRVTGLRDRAVVETLYSTAMRRSECLALQVRDIDRQRGLVRITQGKGRKDRMAPIGERALRWIGDYLREARPQLLQRLAEPTLFLSTHGGALHPTTLTARLRRYVVDAGIDKPGSVHVYRHTTATLMLENGADIRHIQALLGHADLSTTQIYTHVAITHLKAVHQRTHPAAEESEDAEPGEDEER
jgi:integrase/recombinase XerD